MGIKTDDEGGGIFDLVPPLSGLAQLLLPPRQMNSSFDPALVREDGRLSGELSPDKVLCEQTGVNGRPDLQP
jgi:hypothetical protein